MILKYIDFKVLKAGSSFHTDLLLTQVTSILNHYCQTGRKLSYVQEYLNIPYSSIIKWCTDQICIRWV